MIEQAGEVIKKIGEMIPQPGVMAEKIEGMFAQSGEWLRKWGNDCETRSCGSADCSNHLTEHN
jgi:hypothetical protein